MNKEILEQTRRWIEKAGRDMMAAEKLLEAKFLASIGIGFLKIFS